MRTDQFRLAFIGAVVAVALLIPSVALANGFLVDRGLLGLSTGSEYNAPDLSGDNVVYQSRSAAPGAKWVIRRFNLVSGNTSTVMSDATYDLNGPGISGDWVVWLRNSDIKAKNVRTGAVKNVTADGATTIEAGPYINGTFVVWQAWDGSSWNVKVKNLASTGAPGTLAGGAFDQWSPTIHGKRVAYLNNSNGHPNVYVKTIGSSAAPKKITDNGVDQWDPSIGDHLVAWRVANTSGFYMIRYFDYNTGETHDGPSSTTQHMLHPQVSGDRILYNVSNGANQDLLVWDTRVARTAGVFSAFTLVDTTGDDHWGMISGNEIAYMSGVSPYWGKLAVPSISLKSTPKRIKRGARLRLAGSISDQGHRVGSAKLDIERYVSGKWVRIKTITASSAGNFSYYTPKNYVKRQYRVVYNGRASLFESSARKHLSSISTAKTAWPR